VLAVYLADADRLCRATGDGDLALTG
jgi:hypothetical protein